VSLAEDDAERDAEELVRERAIEEIKGLIQGYEMYQWKKNGTKGPGFYLK